MQSTSTRVLAVVTAVLVGCGSSPNQPPDSGAPPPPDAFDPRVRITVVDHNGPMQGIRVVFQNADSSVVLATDTDVDGIARTTMTPGGFVTAVLPRDRTIHDVPRDDLFTFAGVQPGDQLLVGGHPPQPPAPLTALAVPADPTAFRHGVTTSCLDGFIPTTPPTTVSLPQCQPTMDVLVISEEASGEPKSSLFQPAVSSTVQPLQLTASYLPLQDSMLTFSSIGAARYVFVRKTLVTEGGARFLTARQLWSPSTSLTMTFRVPQIPGSRQIVSTITSEAMGVRGVVEWGNAGDYAVDLDAVALPRYTSTPIFDAATHSVSWTEQSSANTADAVVVALFSSPLVPEPGHNWLWKLAAPRTGTTVAFPTLPVETFDYNMTTPDTAGLYQSMTLQATGGYDAVRARLLLNTNEPSTLVTGTNGRIVYQDLPDYVEN